MKEYNFLTASTEITSRPTFHYSSLFFYILFIEEPNPLSCDFWNSKCHSGNTVWTAVVLNYVIQFVLFSFWDARTWWHCAFLPLGGVVAPHIHPDKVTVSLKEFVFLLQIDFSVGLCDLLHWGKLAFWFVKTKRWNVWRLLRDDGRKCGILF